MIRIKTVCYVPNRLLLGLWRIRLISFNLDLWSRICSLFSSLPVNEWDDAGIRNLVEWRNIRPIPLRLPPWVFSYKFPQLARYQRGEQSPQRIDAPAIVSGSFRMVQWYCSFPPRQCNRCRLGCNSIMHCMDTFCKDQTDEAAVPRCLRPCHIVPNDIPGFGSRRYLHSHATHRILPRFFTWEVQSWNVTWMFKDLGDQYFSQSVGELPRIGSNFSIFLVVASHDSLFRARGLSCVHL